VAPGFSTIVLEDPFLVECARILSFGTGVSPRTDPISVAARPATGDYPRHRPEKTLLSQIVERHYPAFVQHLAEAGKPLPGHVLQTFEGFLIMRAA